MNPKRRQGKSYAQKLWLEAMLAQGKKVAVVSPGKIEYMKRKGHLTVIETKEL